MTNNSDRLDRIEALLESASQRIDANARAIEANTKAIEVISQAVASNQQQVNLISEAVGLLVEVQLQLGRLMESTSSINNAALARIDRILDYLQRRDGEEVI